MRITAKGQVTIPRKIREKAGLMPNTEVQFDYRGGAVRIRPAPRGHKPTRGERVVAHLRGRGDVELTTDQIMALTRAR
jgi:AbrB family looped-hinge helix DNA binding protein